MTDRQLTVQEVQTLEWWTVREVANLFRVSTDTINRRIGDGTIKALPFGDKSRRIHVSEVERLKQRGMREVLRETPSDTRSEWTDAKDYVGSESNTRR